MAIPSSFESLFQQSSKVLFLYDVEQASFQLLTGPVKNIWKQDKEALKNTPQDVLKFMHPDDVAIAEKHFKKLMKGNKTSFEYRLRYDNGSIRRLRVEAYPAEVTEGRTTLLSGIVEDVTHMSEFKGFLIEFGRKKNNMLEVVSHDLRGPLAMVKGVTTLLQNDHLQNNHEEIEEYISIINRSCQTCIDLINQLLDEEVATSRDVSVVKDRIDVISKVKEMVDLLKRVNMVPQHFSFDTPFEKLYVEIDELKLSQILNNLLSNAIKFTPPDGSITIRVDQDGDNMLLEIADTGIGIPADLQPFIFKKYSFASRTGLLGEKTKGIGLSIVKDLVEFQGGSIRFESQEGKGTTFYVSFPLED